MLRDQIRLLVAKHVEIRAHRRVQGHVFEELTEVAERAASKQVVVVRRREGHLEERTVLGDDQDFRQRESNPLPQLIGRAHRMLEPGVLSRLVEQPGTLDRRVPGLHGRQLQGRLEGELFVDPALVRIARVAECDQPIDFSLRRPERRLGQEAERIRARKRRLRGRAFAHRSQMRPAAPGRSVPD